ncbi:uncharacterized protein LOC142403701 [Mycteria americana]|uniref:uncharacterized protein LOC142403701 n=1 Tax=Mycteria americana TaxID=33587 RepID=UPI003F58F138
MNGAGTEMRRMLIQFPDFGERNTGLSFKFKIHIIEPSTTTATPPLTSAPTVKDKKTLSPQISALSPQSFKIGPYAIKHTGQQQVLFNPSWSLKRVALSTQISISAIKPTCSPFLSVPYAGRLAWLHGRALTSPKRSRRDVTGTLETGLGVLNSMDAEALANKISSATSNLHKLERSLRSSLSALGTNQWLLSDLLPQWERINEEDHQLIVNTLGAAQINVSLALSCIQAQLWVQSTVAAIVREGEEGTLPTEIQKVIWDNVTEFEKRFQSWCCLVNFTYDRSDTEATAFVLTIRNASVYTIYPIIALGLNRSGTVLCPLEHRVWNKWQTIDVDACVAWEHQGFICDRNTIKAQGICLDTEQRGCPFEIHPNETPETSQKSLTYSNIPFLLRHDYLQRQIISRTHSPYNSPVCPSANQTGGLWALQLRLRAVKEGAGPYKCEFGPSKGECSLDPENDWLDPKSEALHPENEALDMKQMRLCSLTEELHPKNEATVPENKALVPETEPLGPIKKALDSKKEAFDIQNVCLLLAYQLLSRQGQHKQLQKPDACSCPVTCLGSGDITSTYTSQVHVPAQPPTQPPMTSQAAAQARGPFITYHLLSCL